MGEWGTSKIEELRRSRQELVAALKPMGVAPRGPARDECDCPFCGGVAGRVYAGEVDKVWRFKCYACGVWGDVIDLWARLRRTDRRTVVRDILKPRKGDWRKLPAKRKKKCRKKAAKPPAGRQWSNALVDAESHLSAIARQE